jgi:hypothetical protein
VVRGVLTVWVLLLVDFWLSVEFDLVLLFDGIVVDLLIFFRDRFWLLFDVIDSL